MPASTKPPAKKVTKPPKATAKAPQWAMKAGRLSVGMNTSEPTEARRKGMEREVTVPGSDVNTRSASDSRPACSALLSSFISSTLARLRPALSSDDSSLNLPAVDSSFLDSTDRSTFTGAFSLSSLKYPVPQNPFFQSPSKVLTFRVANATVRGAAPRPAGRRGLVAKRAPFRACVWFSVDAAIATKHTAIPLQDSQALNRHLAAGRDVDV
mmetsp:Transcript_14179/g.42792  ORF Transcript_14179/g.42792 Transcript_14179/m.42792 type:complete len:211 (-) Transcript_14179:130-762(-)